MMNFYDKLPEQAKLTLIGSVIAVVLSMMMMNGKKENDMVRTAVMGLVFIAINTYSVRCLVTGDCNVYAWFIFTLNTFFPLLFMLNAFMSK